MSEKSIVEGIGDVIRTYELMDRVRTRQDLVIRDDQFDYAALLDTAGYAGEAAHPAEHPRHRPVRPDGDRGAGQEGLPYPDLGRGPAPGRGVGDPGRGLPDGRDAAGRFLERPASRARSRSGALRPSSRRPPRRGAGPPRLRPDPRPRRGRPRPSRRRGEEGEKLFRRLPLRPARRRARGSGRPPGLDPLLGPGWGGRRLGRAGRRDRPGGLVGRLEGRGPRRTRPRARGPRGSLGRGRRAHLPDAAERRPLSPASDRGQGPAAQDPGPRLLPVHGLPALNLSRPG